MNDGSVPIGRLGTMSFRFVILSFSKVQLVVYPLNFYLVCCSVIIADFLVGGKEEEVDCLDTVMVTLGVYSNKRG